MTKEMVLPAGGKQRPSLATLILGPNALPPQDAPAGLDYVDVVVGIGLGIVAAMVSMLALSLLDPALYVAPKGFNVWFDADTPRSLGAMANSSPSWHYRNTVHPLFSLLTVPIMQVLQAFGMDAVRAAGLIIAGAGMLSTLLLFLALRGLGMPRLVTATFAAAFVLSAAYVHWFAVAETYAFSALSVTLMLYIAVRADERSVVWWLLGSALALGITVTNWAVALAALAVRVSWPRAVLIALGSFALVAALSLLSSLVIPGSPAFPDLLALSGETRYSALAAKSWTPLEDLWGTLVSPAVSPSPFISQIVGGGTIFDIVNNQQFGLRGYDAPGIVAVVCWVAMLGCGVAGGLRTARLRRFLLTVGGFVVLQCALHLLYGQVTFLYAAHIIPALIACAALGWFSRQRWLALAVACGFVIFGGLSNLATLQMASELANTIVLGS